MERGRLDTPPRPEWHVYIDESGQRCGRSDDLETIMAFDRWNASACDHEDGVLLRRHIGNISAVGTIRMTLSEFPDRFPLILSQIVCSGSHGGDHVPADRLTELEGEVGAMANVWPRDPLAAQCLRNVEESLKALLEAAIAAGKPISF
jgi:hypothetical protein